MYKQIAANKRNTFFIMAGFIILITAIAGLIAWCFGGDWTTTIFIAIIVLLYVILKYFFATFFTVKMTGAKQIEKKDNPRLYNTVENLCLTAGLPMPKVYIIDDVAPNAFATGRDPKHAIVAATTGLLDIMDNKELTAVMAHELSHVKNYDIRVSMIVFGLVSAIGVFADIALRMLNYGNRKLNGENSPLGAIILAIVAILAPPFAVIAQMGVSREREYLADMSAAHLTRYPEGMISALKKLQDHSQPMRNQNSATEAMYINNPLRKGFLDNLFSTHPPIEKRIERLEHAKTNF